MPSLKDKQAFWDASAVVPLCLHKDASSRARQIMRKHPQHVVWWGTLAEARSAFSRGYRKGVLSTKDKEQAIRHLQNFSSSWKVVDPNQKLLNLAFKRWTIIRSEPAMPCNWPPRFTGAEKSLAARLSSVSTTDWPKPPQTLASRF